MLVVLALGGNALLRRGEPMDAEVQRTNVRLAAASVAAVAHEHQVVLTHGNGPQVGLLALQAEAFRDVQPYPLDVLDAETEGMVGYLLEQELSRHLPEDRLATLLTQVVVDPADPAFIAPTKPVGPVYSEPDARRLAAERGWRIAPDGTGWRRVVPSPEPLEIVELAAIRTLARSGMTVTCAGGGGIPVVRDEARGLRGVEAVIDKDLTASLLARRLRADALVLLTDVDGVYRGWGTADATRIMDTTPDVLRALDLPPGSMGPKVEAVSRFVDAGGHLAAIGALTDALALVDGHGGTVVRRA
jgi:carbamate kinase